jgi:D-serine deaminase-like pyridoxal phosphate-dependent protein
MCPTVTDQLSSDRLLTPALVIDAQAVDANIEATLSALGGNAGRWRPHVKTAKLAWTIERLLAHGVTAFKCATTRELQALADAGATDVLFAMPLMKASAVRLAEIGGRHPELVVSALTDAVAMLDHWPAGVGLTIDLDVGMHRTGLDVDDHEAVLALAVQALERGIALAGLHAYDGHLGSLPPRERRIEVHAALDRVAAVAERLIEAGIPIRLITTSGSLTFVDAVGHEPLASLGVPHQVSPGTVVYFDLTSERHLGGSLGHRAAAHVVACVISAPREGWITCDAGHKAVSADAGVPTCAVAGRPDLEPGTPSEEHLPIHGTARLPALGELLALVPRHVCPTINLFDSAILLDAGNPPRVIPVTARGRESSPAPTLPRERL